MDPSKASILINAVGLGPLPALESLVRVIGALSYEETPDYSNYKDILRALQKNLATIPSAASKHSNILTEVNSGGTQSPRGRKVVIKRTEGSGKRIADRGVPKSAVAGKKPRKQADDEKCRSGCAETETPSKQATDTPIRRSARTRRPPVSFIFDSSSAEEEEDDDDDNEPEYIPSIKPSPLRKKKVTTKRNHFEVGEQKGRKPIAAAATTTATSARAIATQTSPNLLKQLEREERKRNFF
ncbi:unnamed protein product [Hymenolepis diminuta]|uniref:Origin recognition complex subunit 6 n=1 Tax=Hymenolepis diminuta TaxID=6216 RepID=A0A0R3SLM1_HYMDI|nr:unnamed protein product [Hymenolepis diminuta]VUZ40191.1 unnamed protein product [Hymenolepis diminuta]